MLKLEIHRNAARSATGKDGAELIADDTRQAKAVCAEYVFTRGSCLYLMSPMHFSDLQCYKNVLGVD